MQPRPFKERKESGTGRPPKTKERKKTDVNTTKSPDTTSTKDKDTGIKYQRPGSQGHKNKVTSQQREVDRIQLPIRNGQNTSTRLRQEQKSPRRRHPTKKKTTTRGVMVNRTRRKNTIKRARQAMTQQEQDCQCTRILTKTSKE